MKFRLRVTEPNLREYVENRTFICPVKKAFERKFPGNQVWVGIHFFYINDQMYKCPESLAWFLNKITTQEILEPLLIREYSFTLDLNELKK